jgi:hypothetical protein
VVLRLTMIMALSLFLTVSSHAQSIEMVPLEAPNITRDDQHSSSLTAQQSSQNPDQDHMDDSVVIVAKDVLPMGNEAMEVFPAVRLRALDKITARTVSFDVNVGETVKFGDIYIHPQTCKEPPPIEEPESSAFLQIWEKTPENKSKWIFSGWMFASSPGLSAMDHPVYDVWVLDCTKKKAADSRDIASEE